MSLLNFLCIGLPGLALALETNTARIKDQFVKNIKKFSVPTGLTVVASILVVAIVGEINNLSRPETITISAVVTFIIGTLLIYRISRPLNAYRAGLIFVIIAMFVAVLLIPATRLLFEFAAL